ncbi:MAG: cell division protein ZapA [Clostridia bacterium]|nr:cell division protein ZapA [Clostridia bacterium]MBR5544541.1 cell division protein ZapA [Clostridia bacterium]
MNNKVKLTICGVNYYINTDESPEYVEGLAQKIDERMSQIIKSGALVTMTQAAVLVALEMADEVAKSEETRNQVKEYLEETVKARSERDYYKRELERHKTEVKFKDDQINLFAKSSGDNNE